MFPEKHYVRPESKCFWACYEILTLHFKPNLYLMFNNLYRLVEQQSDHTEYDNAGDHHIQFEYLRSIDYKISKSASGSQEFTDDHAHQCQTDVYLGCA